MRAVESVILIGALATVAHLSTGCNDEVERIKKTSDMTLMQDNDSSKNQGYTVAPVDNEVPPSSGLPQNGAFNAGNTNRIAEKVGDLQGKLPLAKLEDKVANYKIGGSKHILQDVAGNDMFVDAKNKANGMAAKFYNKVENFGATTTPPSISSFLKDKVHENLGKVSQVAFGPTTPKPSTRDMLGNAVGNALKGGVSKYLKPN